MKEYISVAKIAYLSDETKGKLEELKERLTNKVSYYYLNIITLFFKSLLSTSILHLNIFFDSFIAPSARKTF